MATETAISRSGPERRRLIDEAIARHRAAGVVWAEWARERGFSADAVWGVLSSKRCVCVRGQSFRIAVAMGAFPGGASPIGERQLRSHAGAEGGVPPGLARRADRILAVAAKSRRDPAGSARAAGKALGRLLASGVPAEFRMHCLAALAGELEEARDAGKEARAEPARLAPREGDPTETEAHVGAGLSFTLRELADACGATKRHIRHLAARDGWPHFREASRGGYRFRFRFEDLPAHVARQALRWSGLQVVLPREERK